MAINKKLIHFNSFDTFNSQKLSANKENTKYTLGINGDVKDVTENDPLDILYQSICYIKDTKQQWTHGQLYDCSSLISGENIKTINNQSILGEGNIVINEPYLAPFSVEYLDGAVEGYYARFPKEEFIAAVGSDRPLVVPIHGGDTSGITASYCKTHTETGRRIIADIIHGSKVYHLTLDDIPENPYIAITPDNVSLQDLADTFVVPYTFSEIQNAYKSSTTLHVDTDFVAAVNSKKLILVPSGKSITDGRYAVVYSSYSASSSSRLNIRLKIMDPNAVNSNECYLIQFSAKSTAPAEADVSLVTTSIVKATNDSTTVTRPNTEFTVNSIDGASFTNNGKSTAMIPNTVYKFVNNGVNRTIAVYDDHRVVITSENNSTVALSPGVTYTSQARIKPSVLPSSLVTQSELREATSFTPNYMCNDKTKPEYIEGRTHFPSHFTSICLSQSIDFSPYLSIKGTLDDFRIVWSDGLYRLPTNIGDVVSIPSKNNCVINCTKIEENKFTVYPGDSYKGGGQGWPTFIAPDPIVCFAWKYGPSFKEIDKIYLPDNIVYEDELPKSDWNETDNTKPAYVVNRTHFAGVKGSFPIGSSFSLPDTTGTHSPDSYRLRYKGELYKLPKVGETAYYPNEAEAIFSVTLAESSSGSTTTYTMQSAAINLAEGEESLVEVVSAKNSKKLDDFYIPDTIARKGDLVTTLVYKATSKVENAEWTEDTFGAPIIRHEYNEETKVGVIYLGDRITKMGDSAFEGCNSLTSITIPDGVTSIGSSAFKNCDAMTSINIPESVTSIGTDAFSGCTGELIVNCNIPSASSSSYGAFYGSKFTTVTIGDSVTTIGWYAFRECDRLTRLTIGDSVTTIGDEAFDGCTSLTNVTIPDSVTTIGDWAFGECRSLTSVTIPDSVTEIGHKSFAYCNSLTSLTIGNGVTTIGANAFSSGTNLTSVYCKATTPPTASSYMFPPYAPDLKIYVPMESVDAYKSAEWWSEYASDIVGEGDILALEALTSDEISEIYLNNFNINIYFGSGVSGDGISAALTDESENIEEPIDESSSE